MAPPVPVVDVRRVHPLPKPVYPTLDEKAKVAAEKVEELLTAFSGHNYNRDGALQRAKKKLPVFAQLVAEKHKLSAKDLLTPGQYKHIRFAKQELTYLLVRHFRTLSAKEVGTLVGCCGWQVTDRLKKYSKRTGKRLLQTGHRRRGEITRSITGPLMFSTNPTHGKRPLAGRRVSKPNKERDPVTGRFKQAA